MVRTQIQLTEAQARRLRAAARSRGVSMAEIVRRCIERQLDSELPTRDELYADALEVAGQFHDREGATDVSTNHDAYLARGW